MGSLNIDNHLKIWLLKNSGAFSINIMLSLLKLTKQEVQQQWTLSI